MIQPLSEKSVMSRIAVEPIGVVRGNPSDDQQVIEVCLQLNPIGMTRMKLIERQGSRLIVTGLDAVDGSPVLDIEGEPPN